MDHLVFIHSPVAGHLGCFYLLAIVNNAAMVMGAQTPVCVLAFNSFWVSTLRAEWLDHVAIFVYFCCLCCKLADVASEPNVFPLVSSKTELGLLADSFPLGNSLFVTICFVIWKDVFPLLATWKHTLYNTDMDLLGVMLVEYIFPSCCLYVYIGRFFLGM